MERLCDLFFEMSHEDRLRILLMLQLDAMKLTNISKKIGGSPQETYRQVSRLQESGLVTKTPEGDYAITSYGEQALRWVSGYKFISTHRDYFMSHSLSSIPNKYAIRLGELENSVFTNDVMITMYDIEEMIKEAEEYVWMIMDQMIMNLYEPIKDAVLRGVEIRLIRPGGWKPPMIVIDSLDVDTIKVLNESVTNGSTQQKELEEISLFLFMSEKTVSSLSFVTLEGRLDYIAFKTSDPIGYKWCKELYEHYWASATPAPIRI